MKAHNNGESDQPQRPRIGITMRLELHTDRFYLSRHYSEAVEGAGGAPVHLSLIPNEDYIQSVLSNVDGILLPGSDSDVDPTRYGDQPHTHLGTVVPVKDETDLLVLEEIEKRAIPLFAICYGMQVLNVFRGGTLIQDIATQVPNALKHEQGIPRDRPSHIVNFEESSLVRRLASRNEALVNSHHHQALGSLGKNLVATAWAADGLIEAVEDPREDRFVLGVQWHPELGWERDSISQTLFERFIKATRDFAAKNTDIAPEQVPLAHRSETPTVIGKSARDS
jgi:putative glutamine amidotransferase